MLLELSKGAIATVQCIKAAYPQDPIAQRLQDIGFAPGERVRVICSIGWGQESLLVQLGATRFALRRAEAARILVAPETS